MAFKSCTSTPDLFDGFLAAPPRNEVLKALATLLDWDALRAALAPAYKAGGGAVAYDPVLMIKLLLLERLYQLSDVRVVEEAADRLSFREFLGLKASDGVPDDTTLVVFRNRLRKLGLLDDLMAAIAAQLEKKGLGIKEGAIKLVDATLVRAAVHPPSKPKQGEEPQKPLDPDADFTVKNKKPHYGYKLHIAQDRETGLIAMHMVTSASVHDSQVFEELLEGTESEVMADKAYDSKAHRKRLAKNKTKASIMRRASKGGELSWWWTARNKSIGRVRSYVEGTFASLKRYLGCGRARYRGMEKVYEQLSWGVLAFNLKRAAALARG
jgi:IS5 family transposase